MESLPPPTFAIPMTRVVPGQHLRARGIYVFECPACRKELRHDDPYGPMCTGPSETRDEHGPEVMRRVRIDPTLMQVTVGDIRG